MGGGPGEYNSLILKTAKLYTCTDSLIGIIILYIQPTCFNKWVDQGVVYIYSINRLFGLPLEPRCPD